MASTFYYVWRSGLIETGRSVPKGAILLFRSTRERTERVSARARHGRTRRDELVVPGVPEAADDAAAREAVEQFIRWIVYDQPPGKRDWKAA